MGIFSSMLSAVGSLFGGSGSADGSRKSTAISDDFFADKDVMENMSSLITSVEKKAHIGETIMLGSPFNGEAYPLSEVPDEIFASGMLGEGMSIYPSEGKLYAPFDGTVFTIFYSKHAIVLSNGTGIEMLIHIGLETVLLEGVGFYEKVKTGDTFKKGDVLIEFNLEMIKKEFNSISAVLVANANELQSVKAIKTSGQVKAGEDIIEVVI